MALSVSAMRQILIDQEAKRGAKLFDLPASGQISAGQINEELGRAYASEFNIGGTEERALAGVLSGEIAFSDFYGKSAANDFTVGNSGGGAFGFSFGVYGDLQPKTFDFGGLGIFTCNSIIAISQANTIIAFDDSGAVTNALTLSLETATGSGVFVDYPFTWQTAQQWQSGAQDVKDHITNANGTTIKCKMTMA